ncbi:putative cytokinetic ring protein SteA [Bacillus alkalicellulosilyticus]|uniref:putative cytokinetic ring protein SteA n=1 Tax=Alkalihalobacterium alkalicellulosilyticum TaxID=1912214 RepID=UPI00099813D8|nr:putative cytokinetic ring protein SteA [Bacillus alkalicellulosilyticus]
MKRFFVQATAYEGIKTKVLTRTLPKGSIAVLHHQDIDATAAESLIERKVKAVINFKSSMTGTYEHSGVLELLRHDIPIFDITKELNSSISLHESVVKIWGNQLYVKDAHTWTLAANLYPYSLERYYQLHSLTQLHFPEVFHSFAHNSFEYGRKELPEFSKRPTIPECFERVKDQDVLIVARGRGYEADLKAVKRWLKKKDLIVIAVDGGADGLLQIGIVPHLIIGDMDSVSVKALHCGAKLLAHSYADGRSPGKEYLQSLGLEAETTMFIGTSEDMAISFSFWAQASSIFLIGSHTSMNEFLEKGRGGMGSSLLVRMQSGHKVIDLKGIHQLVDKSDGLSPHVSTFALSASFIAVAANSSKLFVLLAILWNWLGG